MPMDKPWTTSGLVMHSLRVISSSPKSIDFFHGNPDPLTVKSTDTPKLKYLKILTF